MPLGLWSVQVKFRSQALRDRVMCSDISHAITEEASANMVGAVIT